MNEDLKKKLSSIGRKLHKSIQICLWLFVAFIFLATAIGGYHKTPTLLGVAAIGISVGLWSLIQWVKWLLKAEAEEKVQVDSMPDSCINEEAPNDEAI